MYFTGEPTRICLRKGDCVIAHVLLPHRGGKNVHSSSNNGSTVKCTIDNNPSNNNNKIKSNIPEFTREMVFFRIQGTSIDYSSSSNSSSSRSIELLKDPWIEFPTIKNLFS